MQIEINDAGERAFVQHSVIQRAMARDNFFAAPNAGLKHAAFADSIAALQGFFKDRVHFVELHADKKSEATQVNWKYGNRVIAKCARGCQQRTVSAEDDHQIDACGKIL